MLLLCWLSKKATFIVALIWLMRQYNSGRFYVGINHEMSLVSSAFVDDFHKMCYSMGLAYPAVVSLYPVLLYLSPSSHKIWVIWLYTSSKAQCPCIMGRECCFTVPMYRVRIPQDQFGNRALFIDLHVYVFCAVKTN